MVCQLEALESHFDSCVRFRGPQTDSEYSFA